MHLLVLHRHSHSLNASIDTYNYRDITNSNIFNSTSSKRKLISSTQYHKFCIPLFQHQLFQQCRLTVHSLLFLTYPSSFFLTLPCYSLTESIRILRVCIDWMADVILCKSVSSCSSSLTYKNMHLYIYIGHILMYARILVHTHYKCAYTTWQSQHQNQLAHF